MYRYRVEYLKNDEVRPIVASEHQDLIAYLAERNKDAASKNICKHIENQVVGVVQTLSEKKE